MSGSFLFLLGLVIGVVSVIAINILCERLVRRRAVEKGWAEYNPENGKFCWLDMDAHYVFQGFFHFPVQDSPMRVLKMKDSNGK